MKLYIVYEKERAFKNYEDAKTFIKHCNDGVRWEEMRSYSIIEVNTEEKEED